MRAEAQPLVTAVGETFVISANDSWAPDVAMRPDGSFVVAWEHFAGSSDIHARTYGPGGSPAGDLVEVHAAPGGQDAPSVALSDSGDFVVAWSGKLGEGEYGAAARLFDASGTAKTAATTLETGPTFASAREVAAARDGNGYAIAWVRPDGVGGVRLNALGGVQDTFSREAGDTHYVAIDGMPGGEVVLVWSSTAEAKLTPDSEGLVGTVDGVVLAPNGDVVRPFRANEGRAHLEEDYVVDGNERLAVAADAKGTFATAYDSMVAPLDYDFYDYEWLGAKVERFDTSAHTMGSFFLDDVAPRGSNPDVAMTPGGNTVSTFWTYDDYYDNGVWLRPVDCHGDFGEMVRLNADEAEGVRDPSVAINERGEGVVVWTEYDTDLDEDVLLGRRFVVENGCSLCGDADLNGRITSVDALSALRASVGLSQCPLERCDTNGSGRTGSADALRILRAAVAGGVNTLSCSSAPVAAQRSSSFLPTPDGEYYNSPAFVSGDGEAVLVHSRTGYDDTDHILAQTIDADLQAGPPVTMADAQADFVRDYPLACRGPDGIASAWMNDPAELELGLHLDERNVQLVIPGMPGLVANDHLIGSQQPVGLACLDDGRYAVAWMSECRAVEVSEHATNYFRPDVCDDEPADGTYLQMFESDGTKSGPALPIGGPYSSVKLAPVTGGRFVSVGEETAELRSAEAALLESVELPDTNSGYRFVTDVQCVGRFCAAANQGYVHTFDIDAMQSVVPVVVKGRNWLGWDRIVAPYSLSFACAPGGACLAAWTLEDIFFADDAPWDLPGIYARPFDPATGTVGEEIRLQHSDTWASPTLVASVGASSFVVAVYVPGGFALHLVDVD